MLTSDSSRGEEGGIVAAPIMRLGGLGGLLAAFPPPPHPGHHPTAPAHMTNAPSIFSVTNQHMFFVGTSFLRMMK